MNRHSRQEDNGRDFAAAEITAAGRGVGGPFGIAANVLAAIGTLWTFLLMFLIVADVIGRNFLDSPITGVAEIAARSVVAIVFLQLASAITTDRMTRSDLLLRLIAKLSPAAATGLEVLYALVGVALFVALAYASLPELLVSWDRDEFFGVQGLFTIPTWPFRSLLVLGSGMAALAYLLLVPGLLGLRGRFGEARS